MIDRDAIIRLEKLSRIELTEAERERFAQQLPRIVEFCESLREIDTDAIEPTSAIALGAHVGLRKDEVQPGLNRDKVLKEAPDAEDGFFRVPKIIER